MHKVSKKSSLAVYPDPPSKPELLRPRINDLGPFAILRKAQIASDDDRVRVASGGEVGEVFSEDQSVSDLVSTGE